MHCCLAGLLHILIHAFTDLWAAVPCSTSDIYKYSHGKATAEVAVLCLISANEVTKDYLRLARGTWKS